MAVAISISSSRELNLAVSPLVRTSHHRGSLRAARKHFHSIYLSGMTTMHAACFFSLFSKS